MKLYFSRHGQSEANVLRVISNRDLPHALTVLGRQQAHQLIEHVRGQNIALIYTSPILRARQTAEIVADSLGIELIVEDGLRECDCGVAEGRGDAEAWRMHDWSVDAWLKHNEFEARIEGGESFNDVKARFTALTDSIISRHAARNENVLCVTHGSMLSMMWPMVVTNVSREFTWQHPIGNCQLAVTEWVDGKWVGVSWCDVPLQVAAT